MITAFRLLGGVMSGGGLLMTYRSLRSVQQGQTVFIAYKQSTILYDLSQSTFSLLKDMELASPSKGRKNWYARVIAYPLPFALQILHYNLDEKKYPALKSAVTTARNHIEHVAFAVDVTVSVLFTYYVAPYYGVGILIGISIEILNEEKVLQGRVKDVWEKAWLGIAFSRLLKLAIFDENDLWDIGLFACELSVFTWEHYLADKFHKEAPSNNLKPGQAETINRTEVNWLHLEENPSLAIRGSSHLNIVETMDALIKRVEWNEAHLAAFKSRLLADPIFLSKGNTDEISDETAKREFSGGAKLLANQIANMAIEKGDSYIRYEVLQAMLRSILKSMQENFNLDAVDDLFQLSLSGGDYCGGGKAETIENVYKRRILHGMDIPLRVKFLHLLGAMRKSWFDHLYGKVTQIAYRLPKGIFDPSDIHFYNISLFYFDKSLKLHSEAIRNDMNITETSFCSRFYRLLLSTALDYSFWIFALRSPNWYSPKALIEEISTSIGVNGLSMTELTKEWQKWVERQTLSEEQKEKLNEMILNEGSIFGEKIALEEEGKWKANPRLLKLMFCDMGILNFA